eukprot:TRINITY_DN6032_c2_g1_i1.p1 TRINITY_DN6032_c2_g1~~TRINITY_DN6032_c2_g1_i1.p1  ORF type:complete len:461 (-),score=58.20 TRINITY_DN6032_c2_g1_i1:170-1552(-)
MEMSSGQRIRKQPDNRDVGSSGNIILKKKAKGRSNGNSGISSLKSKGFNKNKGPLVSHKVLSATQQSQKSAKNKNKCHQICKENWDKVHDKIQYENGATIDDMRNRSDVIRVICQRQEDKKLQSSISGWFSQDEQRCYFLNNQKIQSCEPEVFEVLGGCGNQADWKNNIKTYFKDDSKNANNPIGQYLDFISDARNKHKCDEISAASEGMGIEFWQLADLAVDDNMDNKDILDEEMNNEQITDDEMNGNPKEGESDNKEMDPHQIPSTDSMNTDTHNNVSEDDEEEAMSDALPRNTYGRYSTNSKANSKMSEQGPIGKLRRNPEQLYELVRSRLGNAAIDRDIFYCQLHKQYRGGPHPGERVICSDCCTDLADMDLSIQKLTKKKLADKKELENTQNEEREARLLLANAKKKREIAQNNLNSTESQLKKAQDHAQVVKMSEVRTLPEPIMEVIYASLFQS